MNRYVRDHVTDMGQHEILATSILQASRSITEIITSTCSINVRLNSHFHALPVSYLALSSMHS